MSERSRHQPVTGGDVEPLDRTPRVVLVDNFDSFTYNLYQYLCELGADVTVLRNDVADTAAVRSAGPDVLVISPGPGGPEQAGHSVELVAELAGELPMLGVCLGHQCIAAAFGGVVRNAGEILHGKMSRITHDGRGVFSELPQGFRAIRYHSLAVDEPSLPDCLEVSARSDSGVVMGLRHRTLPVEAVQFHPESVMTEHGHALLRNFLRMDREVP